MGATGAAPHEYPTEGATGHDTLKPTGVLEMRPRSPGRSPERAEDDEDDSPHSISLSVSEVRTAVFHGMMLEDLLRGDGNSVHGNLPGVPAIPKDEIKTESVKKEAKREGMKKEEVKDEVCSVVTRERLATPSGIGDVLNEEADRARSNFHRIEGSPERRGRVRLWGFRRGSRAAAG